MIKANGCIILSQSTKRILLQLRAPDKRNKNYWGFWGGSSESNELPIETIKRELTEEIGFLPYLQKIYPLHRLVSNDGNFEYNTFLVTVTDEFIPILNHESQGYAWVQYDRYPVPLHPGVKIVLQNPRILSKIKTIVNSITTVSATS